MKIILDNIIYSNVKQGGVSNYWFEWSNYLLKNTTDEVVFYEDKNASLNFHREQLLIPDEHSFTNKSSSKSSIVRRLSAVKIKPKELLDYFLYHSSYYRPLKGIKNFDEITTVHDFTHDYYFSFLKKLAHNKLKYSCIKRSKGIICISENTYKDLKTFCPPNKNQKITIIHNGVSDEYFQIDKSQDLSAISYIQSLGIDSPFLLFVGSRLNYKNFSFVAELLKETPQFKLVIVGQDLSKNELKLFNAVTLQQIIIVRNPKNAELNILYNFAYSLVYPSSYEGFGIPIIEAMKAGCPVLALKNSSIVEVSGNGAILLNDLNIKSFKNKLDDLNKIDFKTQLIGDGLVQASKFSWDKCCKETHEFYQEIYNK